MRKKIYIGIFILLIILIFVILLLKIQRVKFLKNYKDFIIEENTIVKFNSSGNVVIPKEINGVRITRIGDYAFSDSKIDSIVIPDTIVSIGSYAFLNNNLKSLSIPTSVLEIGEGAFMNNKISDLKMPSDIFLGNACFNNNLLNTNEAFFYRDISNKELISYGGKIKGNVVMEDGVEIIGEKAFYKTGIISISISPSVLEIKKEAFRENNLVDIYLPSNISLIASDVFLNNEYLVDITIDNKENNLLNYPWGLDNVNINWLKK